jgi:alpha-methylacyl-CoA racemase
MLAAFGTLAALQERASSGLGQVVDAAIVDGTASLLAMHWMWLATGSLVEERGHNLLDGWAPHYTVYATSDGRWMAVGALEPQFYGALLTGLELDSGVLPDRDDRTRWPELHAILADRFASATQEDWVTRFATLDACVEPISTMTEAVADPHLSARGTYVTRDGAVQPAPAPRFSRTPGALDRPAPLPGEHTAEVLADWLGSS